MQSDSQVDAGSLVRDLSMPMYQGKGWMKFLGVLAIIYGVLMAVTIVGIIIAWLPIWLGVLLFQSANAVEEAHASGDQEAMLRSLGKLKLYFIILGVLALIGLALTILSFFMGMFGAMMSLGM